MNVMIDHKLLSVTMSVGPQIELEDLRSIAEAGYTDVVCNRPDAEHLDGAVSRLVARAAADLGLRFHYLPIEPTQTPQTQSEALADILAQANTRVFAYCRSGARAEKAYLLAKTSGAN